MVNKFTGISSLSGSSNSASPFHNVGTNANYASSSANSFQSLPCLSKPPEPSPLVKNNTEQRPKGFLCYYVSIYR